LKKIFFLSCHSYEKPYTRITPFVIGVALGYLFANRPADKMPGHGSRLLAIVGWTLSLAIAIPLLWGFHFAGWYTERPPQEMALSSRVIYGGLQRLGWSLVVGWILFACQYGLAGPVRRILGARFWRPLSNLTYGAYLVHLLTLQVGHFSCDFRYFFDLSIL
jgi:peptidoglycan/LPS O-acetylase OafA/YrhL